jgi:flavin-dependent dehydrogenase
MSVSRKRLDALILERAMEEGGKLRREMVTDFGRKGDGWAIKTRNGIFRADLIVGADGVNSLVRRKLIGPITSENLGLCVGCFAKGSKRRREITTISFLRGIEGYAWLFPRENDLSIGVGSDPKNGRLLRGELDKFMKRYARDAKITSRWGAMLPLPKDPHFLEAPVSGGNWLLAGDAAGHADPLTGEGITYALWSGELAAKAIAAGDTGSYEGLWRRAYGNSIAEGIKTRKLFYNNEMLEIIVRFAARSRTFGSIVYDLIESGQDYGTLPKRVARQLPKALLELV